MKEIRTYNVALRAAAKDDKLELHGTAVSYGVLSQDLGGFREQVAQGAFTRSLASGSDVKCLFNHSQDRVLGRTANGTLTLFDTPQGLNFCCKLDPNQQAHRDLHSSIKRGDISECSFAFKPDADGEDWDDAKDERGLRFNRRTIKRASLYDCSVVTTPAYNSPGATTVVARSTGVVIPTPPHYTDGIRYKDGKFDSEHYRDEQLRFRVAIAGQKINADPAVIDARLRAQVEAVGRKIHAQEMLDEIRQELWEE
jgi:HK97 family phage prohead protease